MDNQYRLLIIGASLDEELALKNALANDYLLVFLPSIKETTIFLQNPNNDDVSLFIVAERLVVNSSNVYKYSFISQEKIPSVPYLILPKDKRVPSSLKDSIAFPLDASSLKSQIASKILTSQKITYEKLKYLVNYDPMTGIYNRAEFIERTNALISLRQDNTYSVFVVGIIGLSIINNFFGNSEGDRIISAIGRSLTNFCGRRIPSSYGRIKSDIFAFSIPYPTKNEADFLNDAKLFSKEIVSFPSPAPITLNYGVAFANSKNEDAASLLDKALTAFEKASHELKIGEIYSQEIQNSVSREQEIVAEMEGALQKKQFLVYYQPKYDLRTGLLSSCEALVRWHHPTKGLISPGDFIPVFERTGFVTKVDEFVWDEACHNLSDWIKKGNRPVPISLNVSRVDIYASDIESTLKRIRKKYDIAPSLINLEITESIFSEKLGEINPLFHSLKKDGYLMEMDDFGSHYSSLNVLRELDFDVIKLDANFFVDLDRNSKGAAIIKNVISLAHDLHMCVVAEGIEKEEQAEFLRYQNCDYVQGYLYSRPLPKKEFEDLLEKEKQKYLTMDFDPSLVLSPEVNKIFCSSSIPSCLTYLNKEGELSTLKTNQAFANAFGKGYGKDKIFINILPEYRDSLRQAYKDPFTGFEAKTMEYRRFMSDGSIKWIRVNFHLLYSDKKSENKLFLSSFSDITLEKIMEKELLKRKSPHLLNEKILILSSNQETIESLLVALDDDFLTKQAKNVSQAQQMIKEFSPFGLFIIDLSEKESQKKSNPLLQLALSKEYSSIPLIAIVSRVEDERGIASLLGTRLNEFLLKPFKEQMAPIHIKRALEGF